MLKQAFRAATIPDVNQPRAEAWWAKDLLGLDHRSIRQLDIVAPNQLASDGPRRHSKFRRTLREEGAASRLLEDEAKGTGPAVLHRKRR
jgi:hypothetical protein